MDASRILGGEIKRMDNVRVVGLLYAGRIEIKSNEHCLPLDSDEQQQQQVRLSVGRRKMGAMSDVEDERRKRTSVMEMRWQLRRRVDCGR